MECFRCERVCDGRPGTVRDARPSSAHQVLGFGRSDAGRRHRQEHRDVSCSSTKLPGMLSSPTPLLNPKIALERMELLIPPFVRERFHAFYSSEYGGIVTDPLYMTLPIDDRMVLRGHGVGEACLMSRGYVYLFEQHFERFLKSARLAGLDLPMSAFSVKKTILHTAAASGKLNGFVRFWLTGGRGTLGLSPEGGKGPSLYVLATTDFDWFDKYDIRVGMKVKTSPVPPPEPYFMNILSNNFLPNVLATMDAEKDECQQGVFVDADGNVLCAGNASVGIITKEDELVVAPDDEILHGTTVARLFEVLPTLSEPNLTYQSIVRRNFTADEAKESKEAFLASVHFPLMGITHWDGVQIGDGLTGTNTLGFNAAIIQDSVFKEESLVHTEIPYGFITGMLENEDKEVVFE